MLKKRYQKIIVGIVATIVIIFGTIAALLSSESVRQWIYKEGIQALADKLETRIKVDRIDVHFSKGGVALYGFEMDDRQHVTMLKVDTLIVGMKFWPLLHKEVDIDALYLHGAKAVLYKNRPDTAANYQFVINAFKHKKHKKKHSLKLTAHLKTFDVANTDFLWDVKSMPHKGKGKIDGNHLAVRDFNIQMSGNLETFPDKPLIDTDQPASTKVSGDVEIRDLSAKELHSGATLDLKALNFVTKAEKGSESEWQGLTFTLPGKKYTKVTLDKLTVTKDGNLKDKNKAVKVYVRGMNLFTDNHKPRKNVIKPHRGAFDAGHMNSNIDADITVHAYTKEKVALTIDRMTFVDDDSGLDIKSITADIFKYGDDIYLEHMKVSAAKTHVKLSTAHLKLLKSAPDSLGKTKTTGLKIYPFLVTADVNLVDISKPFAPILNHFTTPLKLRVTCCGDIDNIQFKNILITALHKSLIVHAQGDLCAVTKKKALNLHFWNIEMSSRGATTEKLVRHFEKKVNLKMQRQMKMIGDIRYKGKLDIFYKHVGVAGTLFTNFGDAQFAFMLDGTTKRMNGMLQTTPFEIGKLLNIKHLGPVSVGANYSFVTANPKRVNSKKKGRLPKGTMTAQIDGARYGIFHLKHITCDLNSDGSTAEGTLIIQQKLRDVAIDVIYHQTANEQWYKYKVRMQKISADEKAARKAERESEKAQAKVEKAAQKAQAKADKAAAKAQAKADKEAAKAAKKADKEAAKAAKKAAKEAAKAAKEAAKTQANQ